MTKHTVTFLYYVEAESVTTQPPTPPKKKLKKITFPLGSPLIHRRCTLVERCRETAQACAVHAKSAGVTSLFEVSFIWFNIKHKNGVQIEHLRCSGFFKPRAGMEGRLKNHLPGLGMSETFFWYLTYTLPKLLLIRTWNAVLSTSIYLPHLAKPIRNNYFQEIPQKLNQICLTIFDPCVISPRPIAIWWLVTTNRHCSHVVSGVTTPGMVFSRKKK